VEIEDRCV